MSMMRIPSFSSMLMPFYSRNGLHFPVARRGECNEFLFPSGVDINARYVTAPGGHGLTTLARVLSTQERFIPVCVNGYFNPGAKNGGVDVEHENLPLTSAGNGRFMLSEAYAEYPGLSAQEFWKAAFLSALPLFPEDSTLTGWERFKHVMRELRNGLPSCETYLREYQGEELRLIVDLRAGGVNESRELLCTLVEYAASLEAMNRRLKPMLFLEQRVYEKLEDLFSFMDKTHGRCFFSWSLDNLRHLLIQVLEYCDIPRPADEEASASRAVFACLLDDPDDMPSVFRRLRDGQRRVRPYDFLVLVQFLLMYSPSGMRGFIDEDAFAKAETTSGWAPASFLRQYPWAVHALRAVTDTSALLSIRALADMWAKAFVTDMSPLTTLQSTFIGEDVRTWEEFAKMMLRFGFLERRMQESKEYLAIPCLYRRCLDAHDDCRDE